ncbi:hypothetical protein GYMLUDRAFT_229814 [Collybiopsis luxurians FD-317 M1]|uniref:Carboxylic ester hydrolase n=1 Tax=Collybiopsis luxurians FD-317 M1 TaxID=944289 RepID=A0A0D0CG54_9AGAR|nr:hypothetical protein GYMLUDRAFT_229814 [Collybiopsis luxurians FD-317 M1]
MKPTRELALFLLASVASISAFDCSVDALQEAIGSEGTVVLAQTVEQNGTFTVNTTSVTNLPALCAAEFNVSTSSVSSYLFGIFLPTDSWNGRFLAVGNGGYAGTISWASMGTGAAYGFAVVSTDTGHTASSTFGDTSWAAGNPEKITDWAYRALHGTVVNGKAISKAFYGEEHKYSYYRGCSTGGRQGLKEAQDFPDDFDGIVAGAPAWWTTHLQLWNLKTLLYNAPSTASYHIPTDLFDVIADEVLKQCDPQDGVTDTIISDSRACIFRPETLLCVSSNTTDCLTSPQLDTLYHIYNDWVENNQTFVFPHFELGTEQYWSSGIGDGSDDTLASQAGFVQDFLGLGDSWSPYNLDWDIVALSDKMNPGNATAGNFDLSPFYNKGGKLLHYHGMSDGSIATGSSLYYREHAYRNMTSQGITVDDFYRFFLVPGMGHCSDTPTNVNAPWYFAGSEQSVGSGTVSSVPGYEDAQHDVLLAMMAWVENGTAPEYIIATKYNNDTDPLGEGVYRQRPLCMYPKQAKYTGSGDVDTPESWECQSLY